MLKRFNVSLGLVTALLSTLTIAKTVIPTVYTLDSAEFSTGAYTLGFVHSPGYPLYLLLMNGFMRLPPAVADIGYRANLFSAVCLVLTVLLVYILLLLTVQNRWIALSTALVFGWSYYIWLVGLFAEVYAPQMLVVALVGVVLVGLLKEPSMSRALLVGLCVGLAVAIHPANALFAPGVALAYIGRGIQWRISIISGSLAVVIFALSLLYFPVRYTADPALNLAGHFDETGAFQPVNLQSMSGVLWMISGRQFEGLFFADGLNGILNTAQLFVENYLLFGVLIGGYGLVAWWRITWRLAALWIVFFLPFTLFYSTYGAVDKRIMFAPALLLWTLPLAFGWRVLLNHDDIPTSLGYGLLLLAAAATFSVNYPRLNLSDEREVRIQAEAVLEAAPDETVIFGRWGDIVVLEYLHIVEKQRPDMKIYNLFMFAPEDAVAYMRALVEQNHTVWIVGNRQVPDPGEDIDMSLVTLDDMPPDVTPFTIFSLSAP